MTIGIIAAMEIEAERIVSAMTDRKEEEAGHVCFRVGSIGRNRVVTAVCGIGKAFAAICAQTMILTYGPDVILNTGVAGTLTPELGIGDLAISADVVQHDMDTTSIGDPPGAVTLNGVQVVKIPADWTLMERIRRLAEAEGIRTKRGTIASGDQFVSDRAVKEKIVRQFGAIACEMEGAAIGLVSALNGVPFVVVRSISDSADGGACEDYPSFAKKAAEQSARLVIAFCHEN